MGRTRMKARNAEQDLARTPEPSATSLFDDAVWSSLSGQIDLATLYTASLVNAGSIQPFSKPVVTAAQSELTYSILGFADDGSASASYLAPIVSSATARFLVQFESGIAQADQHATLAGLGADFVKIVRPADDSSGDLVLVDIATSAQTHFLDALSQNKFVRFAEQDWTIGVQATANDSYYSNGSQWGAYGDQSTPANAFGSQAAEAWSVGKIGSMKIVVGDIDTGIDYTHSDLYLNVWLNQGEIRKDIALVDIDGDGLITFRDLNNTLNGSYVSDINKNGRIDAGDLLQDTRWANGQDNDRNGYADDLIGWDFVNNDNDPYDDNNHGTHVAGTIGAIGGNGIGVAGVNWSVSLMALKFMNAQGSGSLSAAINAIDYYTNISKLDATTAEFIGTNNSWGGAGFSQSLLDAVTRGAKQDVLFVAAAGNGGSDGIGDNNDLIANYPSNYSTVGSAGFESVISVAALTSNGALAGFSNYGANNVDLAAPGAAIWSTVAGDGYASFSGTSMATPHVMGALALLAAEHPEYSAAQLREALLSSTATTASLVGKTVTGGRLDIGTLLGDTSTTNPEPSPTPPPTPSMGITLYGTAGNDIITGTSGDDVIFGIANTKSSKSLGRSSVDVLIGGSGNDLFVLGDARGAYYNDGRSSNAGYSDYALIRDFTASDTIQLKGGTYFLSYLNPNGNSGLGLYWDGNANGRYDARDEFVCLIQGVASVTTNQFTFV